MLDKQTIREIEVSKIRDHFESLWRSGGVKSVEQFLAGSKLTPEPDLLLSLIEAELFLKSQAGETPNARDLMKRFPKSASIVEQALNTFDSCEDSEHASLTVSSSISKDSTAPQLSESTPELSLLDLNHSGRLLGQYELLERLGSGSMGIVVKARDSRNFDRIVALKLLNVESNEARKRFENEAKALCNLDHPSIVKLFDFGEIDNICFIAMQYVDGRTLKDLPTTVEREFIELILPVIRGVHYAHQRGIVHRDIKPSNILIDSRRRAYLTDFGLVKLQQFDGATLTNQALGTPHFMAPEQCRNSKSVDARGDIYALGVVLYWHLAGGYPYHADSAAELQHKICFVPPIPIRERNASVSKDLETIVLKCLEKEPKHRYQAATELADDLQRFLDGQPIHARPLHPIVKAWYWSRRNPAFAALMFLLFFSACLGVTTALLAWKNLERQIQQTLREKELRSAAETAQAKAEVSTRLAQSYQLRTALARAEVARQAGRLDEYQNSQTEFNQLPDLYSVDCQWHRQQVRDSVPPRFAFATSHWGLYDTALSPNSNYVAIADRTGMLMAYEVSTGKVVKRLASVDVDHSLQFAWPRWLYLAVAAGLKSEKPGMDLKPDRFYSSICWLDNQRLVAAGTDGSIFVFSLSDIEPAKVFQHDKALHWVRYSGGHLVAADVDGELILLDRNTGGSKENDHDFIASARLKLNSPVSFLAYSIETQHWIVGTLGGELRLYDHSLQSQLELALQTQIHDARVWKTGGTGHCLLVAAKNQQLRAWNLEMGVNNSGLNLSQERIFKRPDVSGSRFQWGKLCFAGATHEAFS